MNTTGSFHHEIQIPDDVIRADQSFFPNPWTNNQWLELDLKQHHLLTWRKQNELIGYALFQQVSGDDTAHLLKILIIPEKRGMSFTREFWMSILTFLKGTGTHGIYLEVESNNNRAISFYNKSGFKLLRRIKGYYSNGEDALTMMLTL